MGVGDLKYMVVSYSASFSRKVQFTQWEPEEFFASSSVQVEFQADENWKDKMRQLRDELFIECKNDVWSQIKKRKKEIEEIRKKDSLSDEFEKIQKESQEGRKKLREKRRGVI